MIYKYVTDFMSKIEKVSYLVMVDVTNLFSNTDNLPSKTESNKEYNIFVNILTAIEEVKSFIQEYRAAIDDNTALKS